MSKIYNSRIKDRLAFNEATKDIEKTFYIKNGKNVLESPNRKKIYDVKREINVYNRKNGKNIAGSPKKKIYVEKKTVTYNGGKPSYIGKNGKDMVKSEKKIYIEKEPRPVGMALYHKMYDNAFRKNSPSRNVLNRSSLNRSSLNRSSLNRNSLNRNSLNRNSLNRNSLNRNSLNRNSLNIVSKKYPKRSVYKNS